MSERALQNTELLREVARGSQSAAGQLYPLVYEQLHGLAESLLRHERRDLTIGATVLVHEAFVRLVEQSRANWQDRSHFCAVAAQAMRRILIDHVRGRRAAKRGGAWRRVTLEEAVETLAHEQLDLIDLDEALTRLAEVDPREARVVELRFFGGLSNVEVAEVLRVSVRTVEDDWRMARAWLRRELTRAAGADSH
ncbi:MAG: sigma-70 family RNA polymerase sigma factor [Phycisphaerae bacterium]|nr:sigma-70 family RNA polymerase sigma factor [Phycisphaerae bacterium]MCZ2399733.1 sigma-70 family RNA polymerase sigma factor [Phycisphaerae bacterium]NUQ49908.1 sigma-70 family RNA polymerase sigma factor [Phycisphaerae bacterium]